MSGFKSTETASHPQVSLREMLVSSAGALVSLLITVSLARLLLTPSAQPFLVASMGATAVLLYAASASPMAQPWAVFSGHLVSGLVGVVCARYISDPAWAAALAGSGAILAMYLLRCMHPPGGATALMPIASTSVGDLGFHYLVAPVGVDLVLMLALALLINHYLLRRPYPARVQSDGYTTTIGPNSTLGLTATLHTGFDNQDLQHALQKMDTYIDVTDQDLQQIYRLAQRSALTRKAEGLTCAAVMQPATAMLPFGTPLAEAMQRAQTTQQSALPVTDRGGHLLGLFCVRRLTEHALQRPGHTPDERLQELLTPSGKLHSDKPETAGQLMLTNVQTVRPDTAVAQVITQLEDDTPIPVVGTDNKLQGMIFPAQLIARLQQAV